MCEMRGRSSPSAFLNQNLFGASGGEEYNAWRVGHPRGQARLYRRSQVTASYMTMDSVFTIESFSSTPYPRAGTIDTCHGTVSTPAYMPVGTFGPVRLLDVDELRSARAPIVLANALHVHTSVGSETVQEFGGIGEFTGWKGPTLTDSGGYQVSYMWQSGTHSLEQGERKHSPDSPVERITDDGVRIRSPRSGQRYWLTPEYAMEIQAMIGADIVMAFDQPTFDTDSLVDATESLARSHRWTVRSLEHWKRLEATGVARPNRLFLPIVQGGRHKQLRRESAQFTVDLNPVGIAVAGESIGIDPDISAETVSMVRDVIPPAKPLYAMGLGGGPEGFFKAVAQGVDIFDNTSPTRLGRCGYALISPNGGGTPSNHFRLSLKKGCYALDKSPVDPDCQCKTCRNYSRGYLRYLLRLGDPLGMRLLSYHNLWFMCSLSRLIRDAVLGGTFCSLYKGWLQ
jgi:queuine tRNA-ribosyltransferase